ncbi:unnamed protein product [Microthlaspi erraticum]|uniref:Uncharacterized protein n=1 Tax=Microthlaspi erraticum TaxID=1685480 RepID=A0A6D2I784_9BRAS|nr:unnamed protein product [Microthlaspi erraticum]
MSSPQAPPPSWDSPPRLSPLKSKKNLLPYLEAADLETMSLAGPALDWAQHEPPLNRVMDRFQRSFLERFARRPPFKSKYNHYSYHMKWSVMKKNGEAYNPILRS